MPHHPDASYWMVSAEGRRFATLTDDMNVDVAVIGAGVAGISVACELTRAGRSVALLEAGRVAAGVTGHTTAKVSALHGARYHVLDSRLGAEVAAHYATSQTLAMEHVKSTSERLSIDCDLETRPAFVYGESDSDAETLEREAGAARRAGLFASFTTDTGLPFPTTGAVRVENQLMFHPRKYLLGLLEHFVQEGGQVFEQTRVVELTEGEPSVLTCENGADITANEVVVTTHYPIFDRSLLFARLSPQREFAVAATLPEAHDPPGMYINLAQDTRSVRTAPYDEGWRLLIATGAPFAPGDSTVQHRIDDLTSWMRDNFEVDSVVHTWATQDNSTGDKIPFIGPLHPLAKHTWVATGFGGWGMTSGVLSGLLLRDLISGHRPEWAGIYDTSRVNARMETPTAVKLGAKTVSHLVGSRLRATLENVSSIEEIKPGEAGLLSDHEGDWATYVDDEGVAHSVSPTCTHMGCLVAFNEVECAWECPCHGSRFALDGSVLQGPAVAPLRPRPGPE